MALRHRRRIDEPGRIMMFDDRADAGRRLARLTDPRDDGRRPARSQPARTGSDARGA